MDMSEKLRRKTLAQDVFDKRCSLDGGIKTLVKTNQCEIFNFVDLQWGGYSVVDHDPNTSQ